MRRIFTAIDISEGARSAAAAHIEALRIENANLRVGWERPDKLHLTLKFLGDIDEVKLMSLNEAVRRAANQISTFPLRIGECGAFPSNKKARVLWLGVDDIRGEFRRLHEFIEGECERLDFAKETRSFKPHLTIARLRESERSASLVDRHLHMHFEPVEFEAAEIVIYESRLQPTGSKYSAVARYKFA